MCGIIGYVGKRQRNPVSVVLEGLKKLEYRGYDSAGIVGISHGKVLFCKEVGNIAALEKQINSSSLSLDIAIGHTRWATHGKPNIINAHPQFDANHSLAVVHNGIIENHETLRKKLTDKGTVFVSETDTEVIAHLISHYYQGDMLSALGKTVMELKGAFALAIVHQDYADTIFAVAHESPLVIGAIEGETFVASDSHSIAEYVQNVIYLGHSELAAITAEGCKIYNLDLQPIEKPTQKTSFNSKQSSKGQYAHYTLKEIFDQPEAIHRAMEHHVFEEFGTAIFSELQAGGIDLPSIERILILACGTSWHAGFVASYMIEDKARIPVQLEISSEFRYKNAIILPGTLTIAISQSGETADTVAAVRELKSRGAKVVAICNVEGSTLTREADATILQHAGPEIGVCSTKAFTSQLTLLSLLTLLLARTLHMNKDEGIKFLKAIQDLPGQVDQVLDQAPYIHELAKKYVQYNDFFFIGRSYLFPASLEGALKLKEISYINANGYPAGELKHGPIALINEHCPTVAFCCNKLTSEKLMSNLMEIKARNGKIIAIASEKQETFTVADDRINVPETIDELAAIPASVAAQLFAYYVALERGTEIDQPRNLAKSVTVE